MPFSKLETGTLTLNVTTPSLVVLLIISVFFGAFFKVKLTLSPTYETLISLEI